MPAARTPAQQAAARASGTRHGLCGGPFALLPGEDREEFVALHAAVTADWRPRDAYERRWVMDLVTAMWRQDRLHGLEIAALTAAAAESPPTEASRRKLLTFARYGARIDKDIGRALQALRVLRDRPELYLDDVQDCTSEPAEPQQDRTNETPPRTPEPETRKAHDRKFTNETSPRTSEPEPPAATAAPAPLPNRHQRRRLAALARRQSRTTRP